MILAFLFCNIANAVFCEKPRVRPQEDACKPSFRSYLHRIRGTGVCAGAGRSAVFHDEKVELIPMDHEASMNAALAATSVENCYQCGKCTAGCPAADEMDFMPNQVLRLVQAGDADTVMRSRAIWLCVSCLTCTTRCPQSVDCAGVMDVLRQMAAGQETVPPDMQRIKVFHRAFLDSVRRHGRINEVELIMQFKTLGFLKDRNMRLLMKDALLAPKLIQRGKFHLQGESVRDRAVVRRIFDRCMPRADRARRATADKDSASGGVV